MRRRTRRIGRAGFSLTELLVALVSMGLVLGATVAFFTMQSQSFRQSSQRLDQVQNARFGVSQVERVLRTLGSGVAGQQPMLVYASDSVIAFNTDYVENDSTNSRWAVNFHADAPDAAALAWRYEDRGMIPNSGYLYPPATFLQANGSRGPAETVIFYFGADSSTPRLDDRILWMRVNDQPEELVSRNLLPFPGRPWFEYVLRRRLPNGSDTLIQAQGGMLPLIRRIPDGTFSAADSAAAARPDSVRAVRLSLRVTNGASGAEERVRDISTLIAVPNNGLPQVSICGRAPFPVGGFSAVPEASPGSGRVELTWTPSPDENGGEEDVLQYIVYRRPAGVTVWEDPILNLRREPVLSYSVTIGGQTSGVEYEFAVAAQDCTPQPSSLATASVITP